MTLQPSPLSTLLKGCMTVGLALVLTAQLGAVLPKAPVITKVEFSFAGLNNGSPVVGNLHSYLIKWTDNSLDEEGFDVQVKAGSDPFTTFSRVSANNTQAALIGVNGLAAGTDVQFQVVAWKFNGIKVESAPSKVFTFKVPTDSAEAALDPPSGLTATNVDDSRVKLSWVDNSNSEIFYQIDVKEAAAAAFQALTFANHSSSNPTEHTFRLRLVPNSDYNFRVRATRLQSTSATQPNGSFYSNTVTLRTPVLTPPTNLGAQLLSERLIRLRWQDNSTNETSYKILVREAGSSADPTSAGTVAENTTFVDVPVPQGSSLEWQVVALYTHTPTGATSTTTLSSAPSNLVTFSTSFPEPTNLQATMTGRASTIDLTWEDNSSTEYGFNIYTRPQGTSTWYFARAVRDNMTKVSVDSRTESNDSTGKPVFIPLEPGQTHEFVVRAVAADEENVSLDSNIASAQARHGFTSRPYHPVQQGFPIATVNGTGIDLFYLVTTSNAVNRTDWNVTGLPPGLSFESGTGQISGTPTAAGVFTSTMTASFTDSPTVSSPLVLRVLRTVSGPFVAKTIPNTTIGIKTPFRVPLADKFADADAETAVRLETSLLDAFGKPRVIDIHLFPSLAPIAVANFLAYINAGDYNGMVFHRLESSFVLQGGSLRAAAAPRSFASINPRPAATNEPGITNVRGMISAAKVGQRNSTATLTTGTVPKNEAFGYVGNPNSATTDFFFNLNNDNYKNLDNQNSGFTAFGRVSTPGMTVVDIIAALPIGSYQDGNTTSTYNASLDKRILVDGSLTPFSGIPMNAGTAPADMDINKTVRIVSASVTPTLRYTISNPSPTVVEAVIEGNELKLNGLTEGSANVTVIAADLDNASISRTFNVIVQKNYKQPVITKHPLSQAVVAGTKVTFSVTATGTSLSYQWRRKIGNGEFANIDLATGPSHVITSAQAGDVAMYDVLVTNPTTTLTSTPARLDLRAGPAVGAIQETKLVEVGSPLTLTVTNVSGAPVPTFAWKRGTVAVAGQTKSTLNIASAKLTDGGVYTATASNIVSKATTDPVTVFVVDKKVTRQVFTVGRTITLTAPASGPGLLYRWRKDNVDIPLDKQRFSGMQDPALKITGTDLSDTGKYTCLITMPGGLGNTLTGEIELFIVQRPVLPALTGINAPPTAFIGVDYSWKLPYSPLASLTPTSFSVAGLPAGLKLNTATGVISGRATAVGVFKLTASAINAAGGSLPAAVGELTVSPLPYSNIGSFVGTISPSLILNQNKGGRFELTVLDTGSYTAKVILGTETIAAAGVLGVGTSITGATTITYQSQVQVKRKDKSLLTLLFELDPDLGYITGVVSNGSENGTISGFRQFWDAKWRPCNYSNINADASYNMALNLNADEEDGDVGKATVPQGSGYLNMLVSPKGTAAISGRLADGTTITSSSMIGPQGEALLFLMLYTNTGSVFGQMDLGDDLLGPSSAYVRRVDGLVRWIKDVQPGTQRNYQPGIPATNLIVLGATYVKPGTNVIVMGLPNLTSGTNTTIDFSEGGLATASRNPDRAVRLTTLNTTAYPVPNTANTTLSIVSGTGSFTGSFSLLDGTVPRTVIHQGLIIPPIPHTPAVTNSSGIITANEIPGSGAFATGYFLLPELLPSTTKSKINSGRVLIQGTPITITTQPADQTVNPTGNASFGVSIAAGAQGTVTYRWRQDGNTVTGATTSTLNLSNVSQGNEGEYDCVISNGSFTVTSEAATLSVNDPVTVTIARTPSATAVTTGTKITFTATATGTAPLLYQWKKDTAVIPGATSAAYTIDAGTSADNGSYTVSVTNVVSTAPGVTSSANVLTVADPVVIVSVGRTPADATVATGTPVTFSVTNTGTGPYTYQWKKGDIAITGATSETYTIASTSPSDTGSYSVLVKNNTVSTAGVASDPVPLTVANP